MPALWQSSQRPMYVRTVWAGEFRHAVLTHDDPYLLKLHAKRRRPNSSPHPSTKSSLSYRTDDDLKDCLRKLNLVLTSDKSQINYRERPSTSRVVQRLNLYEIDLEEEDLLESPQTVNTARSSADSLDMRNLRSNKTARTDLKENTDLSERVFQWLDLAGKVDLLAPANERMTQPRHSWPELQRGQNLTKSKTAIDIRKEVRNSKGDTPKAQHSIDRHEFYVPTSNTIENYARQSRNAKNTPRHDNKRDTKKAKQDLKTNVIETRQKVITEKSAVQKQYADMLSKNLIPDVSKSSKRQVHIFMPDLPKKIESFPASRTESLLSQFSGKLK